MRKVSFARALYLASCLWAVVCSSPCLGDEPVEKFLDALRENGYYDVALDYLESIEKRNLVDEKFRRVLPFEKAEVLIASVNSLRDPKQRDARLNEAQQILAKFSADGASLEELGRVANYQGNLFLNRARVAQALGSSDRLTAAEKEVFATQSREMLKFARENYLEAKSKIRELIDPRSPNGLKIDPQDPSSTERLDYFKRFYVNLRLNLALAIEQLADTYTEADVERTQFLTEAIKEYKEHHEAYYREYLAAWNARLYEARCHQKLNNHNETLKILDEIFGKTGGAYVNLRNQAYQLACDSWNKMDDYPANEIVQRLEPLVESLNRTDTQAPNWLRVQLELAIALYRQSESVRAEPGARARNEAEALKRKAGKFLRTVAKIASPHRERARELIAEWNISMTEPRASGEEEPPQSFDDARQKAKDAVSEVENLLTEIRLRRAEMATASGDEQGTLQETVDNLNAQLMEMTDGILNTVDIAVQLADEDTQPADINQLRYYQSYAYYSSERYIEAAVIGEFMLKKFPAVEPTRQAMSFVIQSYGQLYARASESDREFERRRLNNAGAAVIDRWPGSDEAARAAASLIRLSMAAKELEKAGSLFKHISDNFPGLPQLAAQYGTRLWVDYREKVSQSTEQTESLDPQRQQAKDYLERAVKLAGIDNVSADVAVASRLLVDVYLDCGQIEEALFALESAEIAPLDLVKQKHAVVVAGPLAESFTRDTYRLALRVYLAILKRADNPQVAIEKMKGILAAMRQNVETNERIEDRRQLSQIYGLIANELLTQFEAKPTQEKTTFASSLMGFLNSIERDSSDAETILWAGSTALRVANSLTELGIGEESKPLYQQAVSALSRAEEIGFENNPQRDALLIELKRQRGLALRGELKFEEAMNQFIEILESSPQNVKVQIDAAATLQVWGIASKHSRLLAEAIKGSNKRMNPLTKRDSNLVWGWEFLAKATRGKNDELFCQAIYHWAESLFENGLIEKDANRIATSLRLIETEESRPPGLNHSNWKPKFESLKQRIEQNQ